MNKQQYYDQGKADFVLNFKHNNSYAKSRFAWAIDSTSWQAKAYGEGYAQGGREYWAAFEQLCAELKEGKPIAECINLDTHDQAIVEQAPIDDSAPFAVGDVVVTRAFPQYKGVIVSIGHKGLLDTYRVRFEVLEGKRADVHADAYEHEIELFQGA